MKYSNFQFTNPQLVRLQFSPLEDFSAETDTKVNIHFSVDVRERERDSSSGFESARVSVTVHIGDGDTPAPFRLEAEEAAYFRWEPGAYTDGQVDALLSQNAVALLISYLRPVIANVTAASKYGPFHLPFLNLTNDAEHP